MFKRAVSATQLSHVGWSCNVPGLLHLMGGPEWGVANGLLLLLLLACRTTPTSWTSPRCGSWVATAGRTT